jgi:hypothetical protein
MRPSTGAALVAHPVVKHSKRSTTMPVDGQALEHRVVAACRAPVCRPGDEVLIDRNLGPVKLSPGLPLPLTERPDRRCPTCYWVVGPCRQRLYKWTRESRFISESNPTLSPVPIFRGARQQREAPLLPPPELTATAGSGAMEASSSSSKTEGMN